MPEFLKHWPEHFQQWFLNWESWTVSDKKILTEGTLFRSHNRSHPGPGWDSHRNTQCSPYYTWRSNSPHLWSLWTPWCLCARGEGCVLQVPSSVWFSKSLVEETNSGNDSLTTYTSNFFFFFLNMCANCIQSCEFEDSNVKTRSCITDGRILPDSQSLQHWFKVQLCLLSGLLQWALHQVIPLQNRQLM